MEFHQLVFICYAFFFSKTLKKCEIMIGKVQWTQLKKDELVEILPKDY